MNNNDLHWYLMVVYIKETVEELLDLLPSYIRKHKWDTATYFMVSYTKFSIFFLLQSLINKEVMYRCSSIWVILSVEGVRYCVSQWNYRVFKCNTLFANTTLRRPEKITSQFNGFDCNVYEIKYVESFPFNEFIVSQLNLLFFFPNILISFVQVIIHFNLSFNIVWFMDRTMFYDYRSLVWNHNTKMGELTQATQKYSTMWGHIDTLHPRVENYVA